MTPVSLSYAHLVAHPTATPRVPANPQRPPLLAPLREPTDATLAASLPLGADR